MKKIHIIYLIGSIIGFLFLNSCKNTSKKDKQDVYTCSMHPQIIKHEPGNCPICHMPLVKKNVEKQDIDKDQLVHLLKATNEYVLSDIPVISLENNAQQDDIEAFGNVAYNTNQIGVIASNISGRIEKLFLKYQYQTLKKGAKVMEIYSPEMLNALENLLFLFKNDPDNLSLIAAAKQKLLLLGMSTNQLNKVIQQKKADYTTTVYSNYTGFIKSKDNSSQQANAMDNSNAGNLELTIREGMYVKKGEPIFGVYNTSKTWALLQIYTEDVSNIKVGMSVQISPETAPDKSIKGKIDFIEPFYRAKSKNLTVRVYFNNQDLKLPIGSPLKALVKQAPKQGLWLPKEALLYLGYEKIVFLKEGSLFKAQKVQTNKETKNKIQIVSGLNPEDKVAENAQYLMDNDSFIKIKN